MIIKSLFVVLFLLTSQQILYAETDFKEDRSEHFFIEYDSRIPLTWIKSVLRSAEKYYDQVADQIGYARYDKFWTWNNRATIRVYFNQADYVKYTGQPAWSVGGAGVIHRLNKRVILTFYQEEGFLSGVLPHEIAHLILHDFIDVDFPVWFEEGLAQLKEEEKAARSYQLMRFVVPKNYYIPFDVIAQLPVKALDEPEEVLIFYAQSVTMVDFLLTKYGNFRLQELFRNFSEQKNFDEAFFRTYRIYFESYEEFEKKWLSHIQ